MALQQRLIGYQVADIPCNQRDM